MIYVGEGDQPLNKTGPKSILLRPQPPEQFTREVGSTLSRYSGSAFYRILFKRSYFGRSYFRGGRAAIFPSCCAHLGLLQSSDARNRNYVTAYKAGRSSASRCRRRVASQDATCDALATPNP